MCMVIQQEAVDKAWGKTSAGVYPGALNDMRAAYRTATVVTLVMDDDSAQTGVIVRYDAFDVDIRLKNGTCKHMATDNVVKVFDEFDE